MEIIVRMIWWSRF